MPALFNKRSYNFFELSLVWVPACFRILDEATSALDNTTEIAIQKSLNELAKGRTSIIVAHRLSTIKNADRIFVVEKGKIIESGSHKELMAINGTYVKPCEEQFALN